MNLFLRDPKKYGKIGINVALKEKCPREHTVDEKMCQKRNKVERKM